MMRSVPRNIDRPNRMAEIVITFLFLHYGAMFMVQSVIIAWAAGLAGVYVVNKVTANKPEGAFFRLWYRISVIGHFFKNPKQAPWFEI
ncbi:MAG: hypothetical protein ACI9TY_000401 [Alphaproteobacteria bacterium]|jgi:hypothetical protein